MTQVAAIDLFLAVVQMERGADAARGSGLLDVHAI